MYANLKIRFNFVVLVLILFTTLQARKLDLLVSVTLSPAAEKAMAQYQDLLKDAATKKGYALDTDIVADHGFHITLQSAQNVEIKDINAYLQCIESISKKTQPFDISHYFSQAQFQIFGFNWWGALYLSTPKDDPLTQLAYELKNCFTASGLKSSKFSDFKAHVSLGRFVKSAKIKLPQADDLSWAPIPDVALPENSFIVKNIVFSSREKVIDKEKKTVKFNKVHHKVYELSKPEVKEQPAPKLTKKQIKKMNLQKQLQEQEKSAAEPAQLVKETAAAPAKPLKKLTKKQKNKLAAIAAQPAPIQSLKKQETASAVKPAPVVRKAPVQDLTKEELDQVLQEQKRIVKKIFGEDYGNDYRPEPVYKNIREDDSYEDTYEDVDYEDFYECSADEDLYLRNKKKKTQLRSESEFAHEGHEKRSKKQTRKNREYND